MKLKSADYWHGKYESAGCQALLFLVLAIGAASWSAAALCYSMYWTALALAAATAVFLWIMICRAIRAGNCYDRYLAATLSTVIHHADS